MRPVLKSQSTVESQEEVLSRLQAHQAHSVAHVRVLLANDSGWHPVCGRIDIARPSDAPLLNARPQGPMRLLYETLQLEDLIARLRVAFGGGAFTLAEEQLLGHGMDARWSGMHLTRTENWMRFATPWPVFNFYPDKLVAHPVLITEVIEAEGGLDAYDGGKDCAHSVMGFLPGPHGEDVRPQRFQIVAWDYRGSCTLKREASRVYIEVKPEHDVDLSLSFVAYDAASRLPGVVRSPASHIDIPLAGPPIRINATLRHSGHDVCVASMDLWEEKRSIVSQDERSKPPPSLAAELLADFMIDQPLATMVARDIVEFDLAMNAGSTKAAVILGGSILEAVLLDVLKRNAPVAQSHNQKKWPDRMALADCVATCGKIWVTLPDGTKAPLLKEFTAEKGLVITDHRDLIHPDANVRAQTTVDVSTAYVVRGLLGEIIRDLRQARDRGILDAYTNNNIA